MKVVHALHDSYHNRHVVASRKLLKRKNGPPGAKSDSRPSARVPAEQEDIRRIPAHRTIQVPRVVCTENLSSGVVVVKSAKDGV